MTSVTLDERGWVRGFPYHDGFLDGLVIDEAAAEVLIALRDISGQRRVLVLQRVMHLHVKDLREGNVVSDLWGLTAQQAAASTAVLRALKDHFGVDPSKLSSDSLVFRLDSSFGADVLAICGGLVISNAGTRLGIVA